MFKIFISLLLISSFFSYTFAQDTAKKEVSKRPTSVVRADLNGNISGPTSTKLYISDDQKTYLATGGYIVMDGTIDINKIKNSSLWMKYFRIFFYGQVTEKLGYLTRLDYRDSVYVPNTIAPGVYLGRAYGFYQFDDTATLSFGRIDNDFRTAAMLTMYNANVDLGLRYDKKSKTGISYSLAAIQVDPTSINYKTPKTPEMGVAELTTDRERKSYVLSGKAEKVFNLGKDVDLNAALILISSMGNLAEKPQQVVLDFILSLPDDISVSSQSLFQKSSGSSVIESYLTAEKSFDSKLSGLSSGILFKRENKKDNIDLSVGAVLSLVKGSKKDSADHLSLYTDLTWGSVNQGLSNSTAVITSELVFLF